MKSIIQSKKECFICRVNYDVTTTNEIYEHHIFEEKQSEKYGYVINIPYQIHVIVFVIKIN